MKATLRASQHVLATLATGQTERGRQRGLSPSSGLLLGLQRLGARSVGDSATQELGIQNRAFILPSC